MVFLYINTINDNFMSMVTYNFNTCRYEEYGVVSSNYITNIIIGHETQNVGVISNLTNHKITIPTLINYMNHVVTKSIIKPTVYNDGTKTYMILQEMVTNISSIDFNEFAPYKCFTNTDHFKYKLI